MCYLKPLKVKKIIGRKAVLENGLEAVYDSHVGKIKKNDKVLVYGNLIIERINAAAKNQPKNETN